MELETALAFCEPRGMCPSSPLTTLANTGGALADHRQLPVLPPQRLQRPQGNPASKGDVLPTEQGHGPGSARPAMGRRHQNPSYGTIPPARSCSAGKAKNRSTF